MSGESKDLRRWKLAASYLHTELARQSNPDTFEMGLIVGLVIGQTHGKALLRGVGERLALAGTDLHKLAAVARRALAATAPIAPGASRYVPKGYRLLPDGSLVPIAIVAEETLQAMVADPTQVNVREDLETVLDEAEASHPVAGPRLANHLRGMLPQPHALGCQCEACWERARAIAERAVPYQQIGAPSPEPGTLSIMDAD